MTELQQEVVEGRFNRVVDLLISGEDKEFRISKNRIDFRVEKFPGPLVNNRANVTIYNLNFEARSLITRRRVDIAVKPFTDIFISAGYESDDSVGLIFRGHIIDGSSARIGPDWVSTFEAFTAFDQGQNAIVSPQKQTYLETAPKTIIDELFQVLNFNKVRYSTEALEAIQAENKVTQAFAGRADVAILKFLDQFGMVYTLDDEGPVVTLRGSAANTSQAPGEIPVVSRETGLVGTPKITHKGVEVRTLLNPELKIFKRFRLRSLTTDGSLLLADQQFTAMKLQHFGSNRAEDFFTEIRGAFYPRFTFNTGDPDPPKDFSILAENI